MIEPDDRQEHLGSGRGAAASAVAGGAMFVCAFPAFFYGLASRPIGTKVVLLGLVLGAVGIALVAHAMALDRQ